MSFDFDEHKAARQWCCSTSNNIWVVTWSTQLESSFHKNATKLRRRKKNIFFLFTFFILFPVACKHSAYVCCRFWAWYNRVPTQRDFSDRDMDLNQYLSPLFVAQFISFQSLDRLGCRGDMRDNSAEILFQSFLREAMVSSSGVDRDLHSLTLSTQQFLCRSRRHSLPGVTWGMLVERLSGLFVFNVLWA